jgi:hypothetical protein
VRRSWPAPHWNVGSSDTCDPVWSAPSDLGNQSRNRGRRVFNVDTAENIAGGLAGRRWITVFHGKLLVGS